jgi:secreted trypsin-like serine protease
MYYDKEVKRWILADVTSHGRGCGLPDYAGIYTRVSVYIDWMQSIVGADGLVTLVQNSDAGC